MYSMYDNDNSNNDKLHAIFYVNNFCVITNVVSIYKDGVEVYTLSSPSSPSLADAADAISSGDRTANVSCAANVSCVVGDKLCCRAELDDDKRLRVCFVKNNSQVQTCARTHIHSNRCLVGGVLDHTLVHCTLACNCLVMPPCCFLCWLCPLVVSCCQPPSFSFIAPISSSFVRDNMWICLPRFASHWTASSSAEWSLDKPPSNFIERHALTMWDIVWSKPHEHRFCELLNCAIFFSGHQQLLSCAVRNRFDSDRCCRGQWKQTRTICAWQLSLRAISLNAFDYCIFAVSNVPASTSTSALIYLLTLTPYMSRVQC